MSGVNYHNSKAFDRLLHVANVGSMDYKFPAELDNQADPLQSKLDKFGTAFLEHSQGKYVVITEMSKGKWQIDAYAVSYWGRLVAAVWRVFSSKKILDGEAAHKFLAKECSSRMLELAQKIKIKRSEADNKEADKKSNPFEDKLLQLEKVKAVLQRFEKNIAALEIGDASKRVEVLKNKNKRIKETVAKEMNLKEASLEAITADQLIDDTITKIKSITRLKELFHDSANQILEDQIYALEKYSESIIQAKDSFDETLLRNYQGEISRHAANLITKYEKEIASVQTSIQPLEKHSKQTQTQPIGIDFERLQRILLWTDRLKMIVVKNNDMIVAPAKDDTEQYESIDLLEPNNKWAKKISGRVEGLLKHVVESINKEISAEVEIVGKESNANKAALAQLQAQEKVNKEGISAQEKAEKALQTQVSKALNVSLLKSTVLHATAETLGSFQKPIADKPNEELRKMESAILERQTSVRTQLTALEKYEVPFTDKIKEIARAKVSSVSKEAYKQEIRIWREKLSEIYRQIYQAKLDHFLKKDKSLLQQTQTMGAIETATTWFEEVVLGENPIEAQQENVNTNVKAYRTRMSALRAGTHFPRDDETFAQNLEGYVNEIYGLLRQDKRENHAIWQQLLGSGWPKEVQQQFEQYKGKTSAGTALAMAKITASHVATGKLKEAYDSYANKTTARALLSSYDFLVEQVKGQKKLSDKAIKDWVEYQQHVKKGSREWIEQQQAVDNGQAKLVDTTLELELLKYMYQKKKAEEEGIRPQLTQLFTALQDGLTVVQNQMKLNSAIAKNKEALKKENDQKSAIEKTEDDLKSLQEKLNNINPDNAQKVFLDVKKRLSQLKQSRATVASHKPARA